MPPRGCHSNHLCSNTSICPIAEQNGEDYVETDCCGRTKEDKAREKEEKRARRTARKEETRNAREQKRMEKQSRKNN
jgi:hypothetical protein